jgi:hypothetical protein
MSSHFAYRTAPPHPKTNPKSTQNFPQPRSTVQPHNGNLSTKCLPKLVRSIIPTVRLSEHARARRVGHMGVSQTTNPERHDIVSEKRGPPKSDTSGARSWRCWTRFRHTLSRRLGDAQNHAEFRWVCVPKLLCLGVNERFASALCFRIASASFRACCVFARNMNFRSSETRGRCVSL